MDEPGGRRGGNPENKKKKGGEKASGWVITAYGMNAFARVMLHN